MEKCPLCDKKTAEDARSCAECGWDWTDHELTPLQIARVQDEIQEARSRAMTFGIGAIAFVMIAFAYVILDWFAMAEVIPRSRGFLSIMGFYLFFLFAGIACACFPIRYHKKVDRLKMILRDRRSLQ